MIPYDQMKAMADQRMADYRAEARAHRSINQPDESGLVGSLLAAWRAGASRSGLSRIGDVIAGKEVRPAI